MRSARLLGLATTVVMAAAAVPLLAAPADAAQPAKPVVIFIGSVRKLPARTATVVVEVQLDLHVSAQGIPREIEDIAVSAETITGTDYDVPVRESVTLREAERQGHGHVNFMILVRSGHSGTLWFVPAVPSAPGQPPVVVRVPRMPPFR
jgi:hypothetical protein